MHFLQEDSPHEIGVAPLGGGRGRESGRGTGLRGPATAGNIIWLVLAGVWLALGYLVAGALAIVGIVTIPLALPAFKLAGYALWPFGRMVVQRQERDRALSTIGNVVWLVL
ncbi:MAG TPA: YccF domain-containing protein [Jiangellaceae bacterium]|nr:YccF domain-containing protein [Jiangellaceae bacterium]